MPNSVCSSFACPNMTIVWLSVFGMFYAYADVDTRVWLSVFGMFYAFADVDTRVWLSVFVIFNAYTDVGACDYISKH